MNPQKKKQHKAQRSAQKQVDQVNKKQVEAWAAFVKAAMHEDKKP